MELDDVITLRLRSPQSGDDILFKFRRATKMQKIFTAYANKKGVSEHQLRFMVDGERILPHATAESLDLEDHDVVEVFNDSNKSSLNSDAIAGKDMSEKQKQLESMKSVIINELEENVSASLAVTPLHESVS